MYTKNAPQSKVRPSFASILQASNDTSDKLAGKPKTKHNAISHTLRSLLMTALLYCVFQNSVFAGSKLVDDLKLEAIQQESFSFHFDKDRQQLQINGIMDIGILPAFEKMLSKYPELTGVAFNSSGGNIYQARGLAKVIISKALDTYVSENCYSACTIAYVAGKTRYMSQNGRLGFHQYNMRQKALNQRFNVEKEQARDLSFFKSRISDNSFIEKIFNSKNSDIWIPEHNDLLKTGVIHEIVPESDR